CWPTSTPAHRRSAGTAIFSASLRPTRSRPPSCRKIDVGNCWPRLRKMTDRIATDRMTIGGLQIAASLHAFIEREALPGSGIEPANFWRGFAVIVRELSPKNAALLAERERLQAKLDAWYAAHPGAIADMSAYHTFLRGIGYLAD